MPLKRVELALNIPTFINLYGYGYKNIYELGDMISVDDPRIRFVSAPEALWLSHHASGCSS